jgi:hypothetical protein
MPSVGRLPAGLAAHRRADAAVQLLWGLVALQAAFTVLLLALRPYNSTLLNGIEVACSCLDIAYLALTIATYLHIKGAALSKQQRLGDPYLAVGRREPSATCLPIACATSSISSPPAIHT